MLSLKFILSLEMITSHKNRILKQGILEIAYETFYNDGYK